MKNKYFSIILLMLLLSVALVSGATSVASHASSASQIFFNYHETETINNGTGLYAGYTDQTIVDGGEQMNVSGSVVSATYSYTYNWSDNQGDNPQSGTQSGAFTWSSASYLYVSGTDDQIGYLNPAVWFSMPVSTAVGGTFESLNTPMKVLNNSNGIITVRGTGSYYGSPDNNAYGMLNAQYVWTEYFDATTGYILQYTYVEQDSNATASFTYTDVLQVSQASYIEATTSISLTASSSITSATTPTPTSATVSPTITQVFTSTSTPTSTSSSNNSGQVLEGILIAVIVVIIGAVVVILVIRPKKGKKCASCGTQLTEVEKGSEKCPNCGAQMPL